MTQRDKQKALAKFRGLIKEAEYLLAQVRRHVGFKKWRHDVEAAIKYYFGESSSNLGKFNDIDFSPRSIYMGQSDTDFDNAHYEGLVDSIALLGAIYTEIEDYWDDEKQDVPKDNVISSDKIFIIHGHNHAIVDKIVAYFGKVDIKPTVLHEKPNQGKTLIEKLEHNAKDIGFAISLWTADDIGKANTENELKKRARQNVIFETGLFHGLIGRSRLAIVYEKDVDILSDYQGVVYIPIDNKDSWLLQLAKEIKAAGIEIDFNKLI